MADHRRVRGEDRHSVEPRGHPPAAPQIAVDIAPEAVGCSFARIDKDTPMRELGAVLDDVEDANEPWSRTRLDDVQFGLVGREAQTVRPVDVTGPERQAASSTVDRLT